MTYSQRIYNMADNYTSDSEVSISKDQMKTAADNYFTKLKNAHSNNDIVSNNYTYYALIPNDSITKLDIFPSTLRTKIKAAGTRFIFKNKVHDKYIILNDQELFVFTDESDFDDILSAYDWAQADNVYSGPQITAQYQGALNVAMNNETA